MAKKQLVPSIIQNKFNKPQFTIDTPVYFIWLGQKKYGYIKRFKETNWGIQYTVQTKNGMRYPCGIEIDTYRTEYHTGCIMYNETRTIGTDDIIRRIVNSPDTRHIKPILANTRRTEDESQIHDRDGGPGNDKSIGKTTKTRKPRNSSKNADKPSSNGVSKTAKRRGTDSSTLESAIEKQRNFLNGFVKRD